MRYYTGRRCVKVSVANGTPAPRNKILPKISRCPADDLWLQPAGTLRSDINLRKFPCGKFSSNNYQLNLFRSVATKKRTISPPEAVAQAATGPSFLLTKKGGKDVPKGCSPLRYPPFVPRVLRSLRSPSHSGTSYAARHRCSANAAQCAGGLEPSAICRTPGYLG